ncbi:MAG: type I methionyl aminopeptidase, partial [Cutibacterium avidum]|nr:type I methionyl aminopeptidase [Cutibacterium avidum]
MLGRNRFQIKTPDQICKMRRAGLVVAEGLEAM